MRRVDIPEPDDAAWKNWRERCDLARDAMIQQVEIDPYAELKINDKLYKEMRDRYLVRFFNKCAYCETDLSAGIGVGDVEHFRPKGGVADGSGRRLEFVPSGGHVARPLASYYWLAYDWRNLLPSCLLCNRPQRKNQYGLPGGKGMRFPVAGGFHATSPSDKIDQPLLLNPREDDPNEHLTFDDENGVLGSKTLRGQATIEILGLNRDGLIKDRIRVFKYVYETYVKWHNRMLSREVRTAAIVWTEIATYLDGRGPYSAVGTAAFRTACELAKSIGPPG